MRSLGMRFFWYDFLRVCLWVGFFVCFRDFLYVLVQEVLGFDFFVGFCVGPPPQ
jgi:hypothetical protein